MYRSDPATKPLTAPTAEPTFVEAPPPLPPSVEYEPGAELPPPAALEPIRARVVPLPAPAQAQPRQRGWIETGFYVMTFPLTITATVMIAPVVWIFGSRPSR